MLSLLPPQQDEDTKNPASQQAIPKGRFRVMPHQEVAELLQQCRLLLRDNETFSLHLAAILRRREPASVDA